MNTQVLPSIRCSRNLRRRTGFLLGLEKTELGIVVISGAIPGMIQKLLSLDHISILWTVGTMGGFYLLVATFKFGKQVNYPVLWWRNQFVHPTEWRAPKSNQEQQWPILENL